MPTNNDDPRDNKEQHDTHAISSAALCIAFTLLDAYFRPVFTHQCFDKEVIRGYQPMVAAPMDEKTQDVPNGPSEESSGPSIRTKDDGQHTKRVKAALHEQHHQHDTSHQLSVSVVLAPSCRKCAVSVHIKAKLTEEIERGDRLDSTSSSTAKKRIRFEDSVEEKVDEKRKRQRTEGDTHGDGGDEAMFSGSSSVEKAKKSNLADVDVSKTCDLVDIGETSSSTEEDRKKCPERKEGTSGQLRMEIQEIVDRAGRALPPIVSLEHHNGSDNNVGKSVLITAPNGSVENDYLSEPLGTQLLEYTRKVTAPDESDPNRHSPQNGNGSSSKAHALEKDENLEFVLCLADGKEEDVAKFHNDIQKLAMWFIETAESVDLTSSEGGGYWKVLFLFRRHRQPPTSCKQNELRYSLVGYMTLFHFYAPFKKPKSGIVARVCQVLVLPPYQRAGHGKVMFKALYDIAAGKYDTILQDSEGDTFGTYKEIVEINVEDPAPGLIALRDGVDYELLQSLCADDASSEPLIPREYLGGDLCGGPGVSDESFFRPFPESESVSAGAAARITPRQVQIAREIYKLDELENDLSKPLSTGHGNDDVQKRRQELHKGFRLMVKKRLLKVHREELGGCESKEEKQAMLKKLYDETLNRYLSVLGRRR